jgi:hypothetical protein
VIDDMEKTEALMEKLRAALPLRAEIGARALDALREDSPEIEILPGCEITVVNYAGDEGGIVCTLDYWPDKAGDVRLVSITHLKFDRRDPLSREIRAYQKHRIKRLRKLDGRPF